MEFLASELAKDRTERAAERAAELAKDREERAAERERDREIILANQEVIRGLLQHLTEERERKADD